jgi:hypothetical protein
MKKTLHLASAVLVGLVSVSASGSVFANYKGGLSPCQPGGSYQSVDERALAQPHFHYTNTPVLQLSQNRLGSSPDEIAARFPSIIEANFQNGDAEHVLTHLSNQELSDLAAAYAASTHGNTQSLLKIFAQRLSDQSLVRIANIFGIDQVRAAVNSYSDANIQRAFNTDILTLDSSPESTLYASKLATPMATPTLDMTIPDIYLEFRTAPIGNVSAVSAIAETTMYVAKNVGFAASAGWAIGTGINNLINTYAPSLGNAIGGTVAGMVDATNQSWDQFQQGQYQASFDSLFGYPISNSSNPAGDFGEFQALDFYINACSN